MAGLRLAIGFDNAGCEYAELLRIDLGLDERVASVVEVGDANERDLDDYGRVGIEAGRMIAGGLVDRALLVCGTGLGMAISANKVFGIRAVTAHDSYSVERSVCSNNAQVLCLGQRVIGVELARRLVREWLGHHFDPAGASARKIELVEEYERIEWETWQSHGREQDV